MQHVTTSQGEFLALADTDFASCTGFEIKEAKLWMNVGGFLPNFWVLPPGKYSLIGSGLSSSIGEEEAAGIVDAQFDTYRDYEDTDNDESCYTITTAIGSLRTLEQSLGLDAGRTVWLKKEK